MWTLHFTAESKDAIINRLTNKHDLSFNAYPLHASSNEKNVIVTFYGQTNGAKARVKAFYNDLKKESSILKAEHHEGILIGQLEQPLGTKHIYSKEIIYLEPIQTHTDFTQDYFIASWNRDVLAKIIDTKIPNVEIKIKQFKQLPLPPIGLFKTTNVTAKQQLALELAQKNGYYEFPRKAHLKDLAKKMHISMPTYQAHLRKAERKVLDAFST